MGEVLLANIPVGNRVIRGTQLEAQQFLLGRAETRPIHVGEVLSRSGEPLTHAVFPHLGILSVVATGDDGRRVEVASVGSEGFVGLNHLMGGGALGDTVVQVDGQASFVAIADLDATIARFASFREAMLRSTQAFIAQLMQTGTCNSLHSAEQRVIRWLLQADDRMGGRRFLLTQGTLATALALRRPTVSSICSELQRLGLLSYSRGHLWVVDRQALMARGCGCYERMAEAARPPPAD